MDVVFLDTNALIKLYVPEKGSSWLKLFTSSRQIVISELALFEAATVLRRLHLDGTYTKIAASDLLAQINRDAPNFDMISLGGKSQRDLLEDIAFNLPAGLRVRALDGIQLVAAGIALAAANTLPPPITFTFVSSDAQLLRVALARGFVVENPETYP